MVRFLLAFLSTCGFLLSFIAHFATYAGIDFSREIPYLLLLHVGIFPLFIPMVIFASREEKNAPSQGNKNDFFSSAPKWINRLVEIFFFYILLNFLLFIFLIEGTGTVKEKGKYYIKDHGKTGRQITEEEYHLQSIYRLRGFSGHWMFFYLCPAAYFWCAFLGIQRKDVPLEEKKEEEKNEPGMKKKNRRRKK